MKRAPFRFDRDYVVQLTDAHPHSGSRVMRNLKMMPDYYNRQQRTFLDFLEDSREMGTDAWKLRARLSMPTHSG